MNALMSSFALHILKGTNLALDPRMAARSQLLNFWAGYVTDKGKTDRPLQLFWLSWKDTCTRYRRAGSMGEQPPVPITLCDAAYLALKHPTLQKFVTDTVPPLKGSFRKGLRRALAKLDKAEEPAKVAQHTARYGPPAQFFSGISTHKAAVALVALQAAPCSNLNPPQILIIAPDNIYQIKTQK